MYIKANHFDYDSLLRGIVTHLDLQDTPLVDQDVTKVLKNFATAYKGVRAAQGLEEWQEAIVIEFLSSVQLSTHDFGNTLAEVLDNLADILTGEDDGKLWCYVEPFMDRIELDYIADVTLTLSGQFVLKDDITMEPDVFANFLKEWTEKHLSNQLEGINGFLFDNINLNILPREYMKDINIMDIPGQIVKYGDTLITFPLILLEVHNR